jgi:hypothetical protein
LGKKVPLTLVFISALLVVANSQITNVVIANFTPYTIFLPKIVIESGGSIVPETEFINHVGNVYSLTGDITNYSLVIQCSNMVLDGKGHTIKGSHPSPYMTYGTGLSLDHVANVTVKDLEIIGFNYWEIQVKHTSGTNITRVKTSTINFEYAYKTTIAESTFSSVYMEHSNDNILTKNVMGTLSQYRSNGNVVTENNITSIDVQYCDANKYFANNFLSSGNSYQYYSSNKECFWDNGSIGNYWSDYLTRFPNASEIGDSGIGNVPYEIKAWIYGKPVDATTIWRYNIDHYPLMAPIDRAAPSVKLLVTDNKTYGTSAISLDLVVNEPASQITYSLDGHENVTINGNTTLTGLANGDHSLIVYATDKAGNIGVSEKITFRIVLFPTTLVIASVITLAIAGAGLFIYFKKRKKRLEINHET